MNENHKYTNKLINENSPYLLSHAHNPVNWYPWGEEALKIAREQDKPIFLSIGYAACHWCHVMEHESFENEAIADLMNEYFVSIKVDREQRPDLDHIYMSFTTALTGQGGWPMSVFLTPDLKPFFAGTYFPPDDRYGRPGFSKILTEIGLAYREDKEAIVTSADDIFSTVESRLNREFNQLLLSKKMIEKGARGLAQNFDHQHGGFGTAPKFPHSQELALFLRYYKQTGELEYLQSAEKALLEMANGGIYDHLGGGFARYATDQAWQVPHFEKMLYDNGLLVPVYADAYLITGNERYEEIVRETLDFILNELTDQTGGFYSALDADSEGEEGKFYVWDKAEIEQILGDKADLFCQYYNITPQGNFEGKNIPHRDSSSDRIAHESKVEDFTQFIKDAKVKLMEVRDKRIRPLTDDKILTSWNGLALKALARGYQLTGDEKYLTAAIKNANFVKTTMYDNGNLTHSYREGKHSEGQFLEDYAYYISGLIALFEADPSDDKFAWLDFATQLAEKATALFIDDKGKFYLREADQSDLIIRPTEETDGALPAPGSVMIDNLFKLNRLTDNGTFYQQGELALKALSGLIDQYPQGMTAALLALDFYLNDKIELVLIGEKSKRKELADYINNRYLPNALKIFASSGDEKLSILKGRSDNNGSAQAYICVNSACQLPVSDLESLKKQLEEIR